MYGGGRVGLTDALRWLRPGLGVLADAAMSADLGLGTPADPQSAWRAVVRGELTGCALRRRSMAPCTRVRPTIRPAVLQTAKRQSSDPVRWARHVDVARGNDRADAIERVGVLAPGTSNRTARHWERDVHGIRHTDVSTGARARR